MTVFLFGQEAFFLLPVVRFFVPVQNFAVISSTYCFVYSR